MNRGSLLGTTEPQVQFYEPQMLCAANSGTPTHPSLTRIDGHSYQFGRFIQINPALVYVELQLQFLGAQGGSTGSVGTNGVYCFSLPPEFPLKRTNPGQIERVPISPGTGMCYLSFGSAVFPDYNVECVPVPADPWATLNGQEDSFISLMAPYGMNNSDQGLIAANTTSTSGLHDLGYAINAYDVECLTPLVNPTTATQMLYVDGINSTNFTVTARQGPGSPQGLGFGYKIRAEPPTGQAGALVSPTMPWNWDNKVGQLGGIFPFGNFFVTLLYEPQA